MPDASSDNTTVVATYPARHYAEMAKSYLADHDIDAFVIADDVHVPLQLTEGARLVVMQGRAQAAHDALADANLLPDSIAAEDDVQDEQGDADRPQDS